MIINSASIYTRRNVEFAIVASSSSSVADGEDGEKGVFFIKKILFNFLIAKSACLSFSHVNIVNSVSDNSAYLTPGTNNLNRMKLQGPKTLVLNLRD